jgi:membrane associated rhomboid family serine protease
MIPYRAKTPLEHVPITSIALIVISGVCFLLATSLTPFGLASAPFQNASPAQLFVNCLLLWVFGGAVENRLGAVKLLLIYLLAGFAGGVSSHGLALGLGVAPQPLGAIGGVLGCMGAFIYLFPFARIKIFPSLGLLRAATGDSESAGDWQGIWVALYSLVVTLIVSGITLQQGIQGALVPLGGLAGATLGALMPLLFREDRESEEASEAESIRSEVRGDYAILSTHELEALLERDPNNPELVLTYCRKAMSSAISSSESSAQSVNYSNIREIFVKRAQVLIGSEEPDAVARMALNLASEPGAIPAAVLLRLASRLESLGDYALAEQLYQRVFLYDPRGRDGELALMRKARLQEQGSADKSAAVALYIELIQRFPNGLQTTYAHDALRRLGVAAPAVTAQSTPTAAPAPTTTDSIPTSAAAHGLRSLGG